VASLAAPLLSSPLFLSQLHPLFPPSHDKKPPLSSLHLLLALDTLAAASLASASLAACRGAASLAAASLAALRLPRIAPRLLSAAYLAAVSLAAASHAAASLASASSIISPRTGQGRIIFIFFCIIVAVSLTALRPSS
jgi:hypothetical protein